MRTGQRIGRVGLSGNASDCHLHFELWSRPGWYDGGRAMRSVSRQLKHWDAGARYAPLRVDFPACEPRPAFPGWAARPATTRAST